MTNPSRWISGLIVLLTTHSAALYGGAEAFQILSSTGTGTTRHNIQNAANQRRTIYGTPSGISTATVPSLRIPTSTPRSTTIMMKMSRNDIESENTKALEEAKALKAQAQRARLEAEKMDAMLTLEKIRALETKLEKLQLLRRHDNDGGDSDGSDDAQSKRKNNNKLEEEEKDIQSKLEILNQKLNSSSTSSSTSSTPKPSSSTSTPTKETSVAVEQLTNQLKDIEIEIEEDEEGEGEEMAFITKEESYTFKPIADSELKERVEAYRRSPKVLREMTAKAAGVSDPDDAEAVVRQMYEDEQIFEQKRIKGVEKKKLSPEKRQEALEGLENIPEPIRDMIASSVGMESGKNTTALIDKLEAEGKLFTEDGVNGFEVDATDFDFDSDFFENVEMAETNAYVNSVLPESTRKQDQMPSDEDVTTFFSQILNKRNFNPTSKPEPVPGGVIIKGENKMKSGDEMVAAIEDKLSKSSIAGKLNFFFIENPIPSYSDDDPDFPQLDEAPVLFITCPDVSAETNTLVKPIVTAFGLFSTVAFALGALSFNDNFMDRLTLAVDAGETDVSWVKELVSPLFLSILLPHFVHEVAHQLFAFKDKFKVGPPTIVPSLQLGIQNCITPIKTPPKNLKSLFDFAISGPLLGIFVSLILMYAGLEKQVFMDPVLRSQLPSLPVELIRSSSLAGGMVEWLLGDGVLLAPEPTTMIQLHPYAIGGFLGIVTNALSLLPIGNTDGGRILTALVGRYLQRIIQGLTLLVLVVSGLFGGDENNLLLFYALYVSFWQREPEIPIKNEVDEIDDFRVFLGIATAFLVGLALIPLS